MSRKILAPQVEIDLGILVAQVHYAVERHVHVRITDPELTLVVLRRIVTVDTQVLVRISVISELPQVRLHVSFHHAVVDLAARLKIQGQRTDLRLVQQPP